MEIPFQTNLQGHGPTALRSSPAKWRQEPDFSATFDPLAAEPAEPTARKPAREGDVTDLPNLSALADPGSSDGVAKGFSGFTQSTDQTDLLPASGPLQPAGTEKGNSGDFLGAGGGAVVPAAFVPMSVTLRATSPSATPEPRIMVLATSPEQRKNGEVTGHQVPSRDQRQLVGARKIAIGTENHVQNKPEPENVHQNDPVANSQPHAGRAGTAMNEGKGNPAAVRPVATESCGPDASSPKLADDGNTVLPVAAAGDPETPDLRRPAESIASQPFSKTKNLLGEISAMTAQQGRAIFSPGSSERQELIASAEALPGDPDISVGDTMNSSHRLVAGTADAVVTRPSQVLVEKVATHILELADRNGRNTVELRLDPPELGRLRLQMSGFDSGLTAVISVERPETEALLRRHLHLLEDALRLSGYTSVDLGFSSQNSNFSEGTQPGLTAAIGEPEFEAADTGTFVRKHVAGSTELDIRL